MSIVLFLTVSLPPGCGCRCSCVKAAAEQGSNSPSFLDEGPKNEAQESGKYQRDYIQRLISKLYKELKCLNSKKANNLIF